MLRPKYIILSLSDTQTQRFVLLSQNMSLYFDNNYYYTSFANLNFYQFKNVYIRSCNLSFYEINISKFIERTFIQSFASFFVTSISLERAFEKVAVFNTVIYVNS